jgi:hypothetical protein
MADFNVRSDSVNVEQIMEQIRARIREKRGVDYTEQQIRELAAVKLEKMLEPTGVRSDLLKEFHSSEPDQNYAFEDDTLFETHRAPIRWIRSLLRPVLKLLFNPNPLAHVLHMQSQINDRNASRHRLSYELLHNLVVETTRLGIEVKNLKMRVESLSSRVEFNERRARALESAVVYQPSPEDREERADSRIPTKAAAEIGTSSASMNPPAQVAQPGGGGNFNGTVGQGGPGGVAGQGGPGQRSRRRRRRRGRRGGGSAVAMMGQPTGAPGEAPTSDSPEAPRSSEPNAPPLPDTGNDSGQ